jgi:hypothetical protein
MKNTWALFVVLSLLLSSCSSVLKSEPTATNTPAPTATVTNTLEPTATATATPIVIPSYMNEFIEKGYDKLSKDGILYLVNQEDHSMFADENGISFNGLKILSWMTGISYYDDQGVFHDDGIILDGVCREMGPQIFWDAIIDSDTIHSDPICPRLIFYKNQRISINKLTVGEFQIYKGFVGSAIDTDRNKIFEGIFPIVDGKAQPVNIPGIGTVLPIFQVKYENFVLAK